MSLINNNFKVIRASVFCNNSVQLGSFSPNHIFDHSVLCLKFETNFDMSNEVEFVNHSHSSNKNINLSTKTNFM